MLILHDTRWPASARDDDECFPAPGSMTRVNPRSQRDEASVLANGKGEKIQVRMELGLNGVKLSPLEFKL